MTYHDWRDQFAAVMDERFYTISWLDVQIENGAAKFWTDGQGAIIATMRHYPTGATEVHGLIAAGDLESILSLIPKAEQWGREQGCIVAGIDSREGWLKALPDYELYQVCIRKELH